MLVRNLMRYTFKACIKFEIRINLSFSVYTVYPDFSLYKSLFMIKFIPSFYEVTHIF